MQLGLVTYMWGADWDLPTLIKNCEATGFADKRPPIPALATAAE